MQIISEELQRIANELNMIYVRALNVNDLNQKIQAVKVERPLLVYANLSAVEFPETGSNFEYFEAETTVYVLDLSKTPDPTAEEIDAQLAPLFVLGNSIFDALSDSTIIYSAANIERGTMTAAEQIERTDEVLNGWEMVLTLPIQRRVYYCPGSRLLDSPFESVEDSPQNPGFIQLSGTEPRPWVIGMIVIIQGTVYDGLTGQINGGGSDFLDVGIPFTEEAGPGHVQEYNP